MFLGLLGFLLGCLNSNHCANIFANDPFSDFPLSICCNQSHACIISPLKNYVIGFLCLPKPLFFVDYRIWTSLLTTKHYMIRFLHLATFFLARYLLMVLASPKAMVLYNLKMKNLLNLQLIN